MFKCGLIVRRIIGVKNCWQLKEPLVYIDRNRDIQITVPKDFIFDFASVPRLLTNIFPKSGARYDRASCLHDWLYATKRFSRKISDQIFFEAMLSDRVPKWKAKLMYFGVRIGGWYAWEKHTKKDVEKMKELRRKR